MLIYGGSVVDHRTPIEDRWGGWFVTGAPAGLRHLRNAVIGPQGDPKTLESLQGNIDSDVAALMVFNHQMYMANLIIRIGWDTRAGLGKLEDEAREFVDYLLFVDEAPLQGKLQGPFAGAMLSTRCRPRPKTRSISGCCGFCRDRKRARNMRGFRRPTVGRCSKSCGRRRRIFPGW